MITGKSGKGKITIEKEREQEDKHQKKREWEDVMPLDDNYSGKRHLVQE